MCNHSVPVVFSGRRAQRLTILVLLLLAALGAWRLPFARGADNCSRSYRIVIDSIDGGSGASASASWLNVESAIGQESVCGVESCASAVDHAGVVQNWSAPASATEWRAY